MNNDVYVCVRERVRDIEREYENKGESVCV